MSNFAEDYIPVNERIVAFYEKHPEGSLQSEMVELSDSRVVMRGYAYRSPDDPRPGIGYASQEIPGSTPFTRGSEVENCETSAWGRAIAALGFEVKRGIASAEEVRNKQHSSNGTGRGGSPQPRPAAVPQRSSTSVPEEPEFPDDFAPTPIRSDNSTCPIHGVEWVGQWGDLWHKDEDGRYCRHPENTRQEGRKAAGARR